MNNSGPNTTYRILVIDDNQDIHNDFRKILCGEKSSNSRLDAAEAALFGSPNPTEHRSEFEVDSAYQAQDGLAQVLQAIHEGRPYTMAFVDVRMPPGLDGIEITPKLWVADSDLQIVICTAYSDYSWEQMLIRVGVTDRMFILKKPFERIEVLQLAHSLTEKRRMATARKLRQEDLGNTLRVRAKALEQMRDKLEAEIAELKRGIKKFE
jgi:CheY-like chemotaxis protein